MTPLCMFTETCTIGYGVGNVTLVEGTGKEGCCHRSQGIDRNIFATMGGPLARNRGTMDLVAVFVLSGSVDWHRTGVAVARAVAVQKGAVELAVNVGQFAVGTCNTKLY